MSQIRQVYMQSAVAAIDLMRSPELAEAWDEVSVLPAFRVSGLAGHLARSVFQVMEYLDAPMGSRDPIDAAEYYAELEGTSDIGSSLNMSVRDRGDSVARHGLETLLSDVTRVFMEVKGHLDAEPALRRVSVYRGRVLLLDEYLKTRVVELVVHLEDLALSIGAGVAIPADAIKIATDVVTAAARRRHGDLAVLRAMTRRERDDIDATRLL